MNKGKAKEVLDFIVAICSIVSCVVAVYGVFQVVDFVVDVKPIVIPIAQEVKDGNLDMKTVLSGVGTVVRHDTILMTKRDTVYLSQDETRQNKKEASLQRTIQERRLTPEEEQRLDHSADQVSKQEKQDIDNQEANFRQRMRNKMKQNRMDK